MPCASGSKLTPGRAVVSRWYGRTGAIHSTVGALAAKSRACGLPARAMTCGSCGGATRHGPPPAISGPLSCRSTKPSTSSLPKASSGSGLDAYIRYKTCKAKLRFSKLPDCRAFARWLPFASLPRGALVQDPLQRPAVHVEAPRGLRDVAAALLEHALDVLPAYPVRRHRIMGRRGQGQSRGEQGVD